MGAMHALGELISERMRLEGWSLQDVVDRAVAQGEKLGKSNLASRVKEAPDSLTRSNLFGIAAGIGVTPLTVANAALRSMGIEPHAVEVTDSLATIAIDPTLSERDRRRLRALIEEMRSDGAEEQPIVEVRRRTRGEHHGVADDTESDASSEAGKAQEVSRRPADFTQLGAKSQRRRRT